MFLELLHQTPLVGLLHSLTHSLSLEYGTQKRAYSQGNPKTLTPGPRTPTTDWVRGLPTDRSEDYPYGPIYGPPPKLNLKERKQ